MNEKIILAPGVSSSELLRTLAKYGVNTMGWRVMSSVELAKFAMMKSGQTLNGEFMTSAEEPSVIYSFLNEIPYFNTASFADAENLALTLNEIRMLIPDGLEKSIQDLLSAGEFEDKNKAVAEAYKRYTELCRQEQKIDAPMLIRNAIYTTITSDNNNSKNGDQNGNTNSNINGNKNDNINSSCEYLTLKEFPIKPLERSLIERLSGGQYREVSLVDLFGVEPKPLTEPTVTEGYGEINEVEDIINDIYSRKLSLDKCVVACAGNSYAQVFFDLSKQHNIPMTFGSGIPISNTNPARLLKLLYAWNTSGYNGIDALRKLLTSDAIDTQKLLGAIADGRTLLPREFEKMIREAGSLRISMDASTNKFRLDRATATGKLTDADMLSKLAGEFELGMADFISKYSVIRPEPVGRIDQSAVNVITSTIEAYERYAEDGDISEIIPEILAKTVCSENSREGALHITSIQSAMNCMRDNLYVCGLSATNFPGSPTENYLMLDNDLKEFNGIEAGGNAPAGNMLPDNDNASIICTSTNYKVPDSETIIRDKIANLENLLRLAASLGAEIKLSYSGYSLSGLKAQNPSSVLFNIFESINPNITMDEFRNRISKALYFTAALDSSRIVADEYSRGAVIDYAGYEAEKLTAESALEKEWSPSALSIFFQCPRHFYLRYIMRIPEEEPDDPFVVLDAAKTGTLAHSMMEQLAANKMSREDFLEASEKAYDETLQLRPPMHQSEAEKQKKEFIRMMETAYDGDPKNEVVSAEEEYHFEHPTGIKLHGYPDRVEKTVDGRYIIADFKTMRKIEHIQDDFNTCMQVIVYAWMCEQAGMDISSCEYRYLRKGKSVSCKYDNEIKSKLDDFLGYFKQCIENNDFERNENKVSCKYCKMADICKWECDNSDAGQNTEMDLDSSGDTDEL